MRFNEQNVAKTFYGKKLAGNDQIIRRYGKQLTPGCCRDYIHVNDHYFQTYSLKLLGQSRPTFSGRRDESLYKWSRSHDQDDSNVHIYGKNL